MLISDIDCSKYPNNPEDCYNFEWNYFQLPEGLWNNLKPYFSENKWEHIRHLLGMYWELLCKKSHIVDYDDFLCFAETLLELLEN